MNFTAHDQLVINNFIKTVSNAGINELSTEEELWSLADAASKQLLDKIVTLNPMDYGFKGELLQKEPVPKDAIQIVNKLNNVSDGDVVEQVAYLTKSIYESFAKMSEKFTADHPSRELMVGSGYRSPAYQIVIMLHLLANVYDFNIAKTLKRVAMPLFSQHCSVSNTAIDMLNIDGEPSNKDPEKFKDSIEYQWLLKNAFQFGFYESYPRNNPDGIMYEPWHWQYRL